MTFLLAANDVFAQSFSAGDKNRGRVSAAGQSLDFQFDETGHSPTSPGWVDTDFTFTANSPSTTLLFEGTSPGAAGASIDNVRVTALPEPTTAALARGGLFLLWRVRR